MAMNTGSRLLQAMSSPEEKAYEIMRELDVNYVLVIFGGLTGYASDGNSLSLHCSQLGHHIHVTHGSVSVPLRYQQVSVDGAYRRQH